MSYTDLDWSELEVKERQILAQLESTENQGWKTKSQLIRDYVDLERKKLDAGRLPITNKKEFCSYIYSQLTQVRNISLYKDGDFYAIFEEDEKHSEKNPISVISRQEISSAFQTADEQVKEAKIRITDKYTDYLEYASVSVQQCKELIDDIMNKYPDYQAEIQEGLGQVDKLMDEEKEIRAQLEHIAANLDLRNKAREWKKIKALLLEKIELNIAAVAKSIHISPKHMSANIMRNEQSEILEKAKWFDVVDVICSCGIHNVIDWGDWWNKQLKRGELSLPFKKPTITHIVN